MFFTYYGQGMKQVFDKQQKWFIYRLLDHFYNMFNTFMSQFSWYGTNEPNIQFKTTKNQQQVALDLQEGEYKRNHDVVLDAE